MTAPTHAFEGGTVVDVCSHHLHTNLGVGTSPLAEPIAVDLAGRPEHA